MIEIVKYTDQHRKMWDAFVDESNNGTMFHKQRFFDYHSKGKFKFDHLMFFNDKKLVALLPGSIVEGNIFESPIGASYGSIVTKDVKFNEAVNIVNALLDYSKANGIKEILLTAVPMVYERHPNQNLDFAMLWLGFSYQLHYISSAIKLDPEIDILSRFSQTIRRNVRRSLDNEDIKVEVNEKYEDFYPILLENKARHDVKPTHSLEDIYKLKSLMPNALKLFNVYYKDEPIGGSLMFYPNETVALCFYNMLKYEYQHLKPIQRVMYEVVKDATELGYKYVDIGVSQDTKAENPMTPSMSLIEFKEKFDAKTIMRNTLHINL